MLATHSIKAINSRMQQSAIRAALTQQLPPETFSSQLLPVKYFAAPTNAADIRSFRELAEYENSQQTPIDEIGTELPTIQDGRITQVLLPYANDYVSITPVCSLALMYAVNGAKLGRYEMQTLQPVIAAIGNHGDPVCAFKGYTKLINNWLFKEPEVSTLQTPVVLLTARCERIVLANGYITYGLPALTAIGGAVHVLERHTGFKIPFAFGLKNRNGFQDAKMGQRTDREHRTNTDSGKKVVFSHEVTANADIAIALKFEGLADAEKVIEACKLLQRLAGGQLFDVEARITTEIPGYNWYNEPNDPYQCSTFDQFIHAVNKGYSLVQTGFALLEKPTSKKMARLNPHAWAEPIFHLFSLGQLNTFFKLDSSETVIYWRPE